MVCVSKISIAQWNLSNALFASSFDRVADTNPNHRIMTSTKTIIIAAGGAAATFGLIYLGAKYHPGMKLLGPLHMSLLYLLLPAEWIGEACSSFTLFLIVGFLEFFYPYWLGLRIWNARKRA